MRLATLFISTLLLVASLPLLAQGDTITRNPKCVQLKRIWKLEGDVVDARLGGASGSVGDVNGDGIGDFAVMRDLPAQWMIFYGSRDSISTTPAWTTEGGSYDIPHPVVGDFWGTGHRAVGLARSIYNPATSRQYDWLRIHRTDSNRLEDEPSAVWYAASWKDTTLPAFVTEALAADLDRDGDDELIVAVKTEALAADLDRDGDDELIVAVKWVRMEGRYGQIWIYDGGPEFQVETPSVVIKDPELNEDSYRLHAGDIDGDGQIDLMSVKRAAGVTKADFYWSSSGWPAAGRQPDRTTVTGDPQDGDYAEFAFLVECDGDGVMDVMTNIARIWRSGSGKDPHARAWTISDADIYLRSAGGPFGPGGRPGYLNSRRYEMVGTGWAPGLIFFSGGPNGPDLDYDARFYPGAEGLTGRTGEPSPVGDVNGDGWDDAISGDGGYPDQWYESGIAIILAGGPYIPTDEPAVGVRQIPLGNKGAALSIWPNPVRTELNIAWRGDLVRMPRRFEIHDMLGRLVSQGSVPDGDGAAIWNRSTEPAGQYILSIFDRDGQLLSSEQFTTQ